jgi:hypothetical protein
MRLVVITGFALLLLVAPGCPDSEELTIDTAMLTLHTRPVNTAGVRYETATLRIAQIEYEAADPDADQGPSLSGTFTFPETIDVSGPTTEVPAGVLNSGQYIVRRMVITSLALRDDNPPNPNTTCIEGVVNPGPDGTLGTADDFGQLPDQRFSPPVVFPSTITYPDFGGPTFNVSADGGTLNLTVDTGLLISAYENSFLCFAASGGVCNVGGGPVTSNSCIVAFNANDFVTNSTAAFTFN